MFLKSQILIWKQQQQQKYVGRFFFSLLKNMKIQFPKSLLSI